MPDRERTLGTAAAPYEPLDAPEYLEIRERLHELERLIRERQYASRKRYSPRPSDRNRNTVNVGMLPERQYAIALTDLEGARLRIGEALRLERRLEEIELRSRGT